MEGVSQNESRSNNSQISAVALKVLFGKHPTHLSIVSPLKLRSAEPMQALMIYAGFTAYMTGNREVIFLSYEGTHRKEVCQDRFSGTKLQNSGMNAQA
jgi:hypothetical protein